MIQWENYKELTLVIGQWSLGSEMSKVSMLSELRRLKASKPGLNATFDVFQNIRCLVSVQSKKPSGRPEGP